MLTPKHIGATHTPASRQLVICSFPNALTNRLLERGIQSMPECGRYTRTCPTYLCLIDHAPGVWFHTVPGGQHEAIRTTDPPHRAPNRTHRLHRDGGSG